MLVTKDYLPNLPLMEGMQFRNDHLYTKKVNELFKKNQGVLKKLYEAHISLVTKYMRMQDVLEIVKKAGVNMTPQKINACYVESMMSRLDTIKDVAVGEKMRYVEFIVFIGRMAHEIHSGTKQEGMEMHDKIDAILDPLL